MISPFFRLRRPKGTSFRVRTAIFLFFVVVSVGLVIGATLRFGTRVALENEIDLLLREDAEELSQVLRSRQYVVSQDLAAEWNRRAAVHELHHWFIRVIGEDNVPIWESISVPSNPPLPVSVQGSQPANFDEYRIIQRILSEKGSERLVYLQIGTGLDNFNRDLWLLDRLLLITLSCLCLIGPLSAWILSGHLVEPLGNLTSAAERLEIASSTDLLPLRQTHDELDRLAETINHLLLRVRRELKRREDWLANSAHQLRSPLAAISSNVEVVANRMSEGTSRAMLDSVLEECVALRSLVNKLLLLSEADADRLKPKSQSVNMSHIVRQSCEIYEGLALQNQIALELGRVDECTLDGNAHYLRHVVQNLVDNAIKYTHPNGKVVVELMSLPDENKCRFRVADTGGGISPEDLAKVTERFYRTDSGRNPEHTPRGSGLGLSICQSIVQGHSGTMEIESQIGIGTTVTVDLPLRRSLS